MGNTIAIDDDLAVLLRAAAERKGEDMNNYAVSALREAMEKEKARERGRALLAEPTHPFDLEAMRAKYGLPPGRSEDEIAEAAERAIEAMTPAQREQAERFGIL